MESLKLLQELSVMADDLNVTSLKHFFKNFNPSNSRPLAQTITHFHLKDLESADYRSAYGQLSDWLYGWNVNDATEYGDEHILDHFQTKRKAREMDLRMERERTEADRIMKIYETLHQMTRRILTKCYNDLEDEIPKIGRGVGTFKTGQQDDDDFFDDEADLERVWALKSAEELDTNIPIDMFMENMETSLTTEDISMMRTDVIVKKSNKVEGEVNSRRGSSVGGLKEGVIIEESEQATDNAEEGLEQGLEKGLEKEEDDEIEQESIHSEATSVRSSVIGTNPSASAPPQTSGFQFMNTKDGKPGEVDMAQSSSDEERLAIQRDINHIHVEVDRCTDFTLVTLSTIMVVVSFSELLGDKENYIKYLGFAHELSMDFVSNTLKAMWDLLNKELPGEVTLAELRSPNLLRLKIRRILEFRKKDGKIPKFKIRKIHFKFALIHDMFTMLDIFIFPNFIAAHSNGLKSAEYSSYDNSLWLTGGHDGVVKITDVRAANSHLCLAQYISHKSIITDVHFARKESYIVSSSFDRTIKIWNSQSASCERTLTGHIDAVLSCDLHVDGRLIASGSTDNTAKLWDFNTGECIVTIKKHTRWVKVVKFTLDGKYLITASLDKRIYLWDVKLLLNSKSPIPFKCLDVHLDYVLDIAVNKNGLLSTSRDGTIRYFDIYTGQEQRCHTMSPSWACTLCFSENGEYFATGSFDNNIMIFRTSDFTKIRQIRVFNFGIMTVRFPNDLSFVVAGTNEGFLQQIPL